MCQKGFAKASTAFTLHKPRWGGLIPAVAAQTCFISRQNSCYSMTFHRIFHRKVHIYCDGSNLPFYVLVAALFENGSLSTCFQKYNNKLKTYSGHIHYSFWPHLGFDIIFSQTWVVYIYTRPTSVILHLLLQQQFCITEVPYETCITLRKRPL